VVVIAPTAEAGNLLDRVDLDTWLLLPQWKGMGIGAARRLAAELAQGGERHATKDRHDGG